MAQVAIEIFHKKSLASLLRLFKNYQFKPYYFLKQLKPCDKLRLFNKLLKKGYLSKSNFLLTAKERNKYRGFLLLEKQIWDSSFFGFPCYKIDYLHSEGRQEAQRDIKSKLIKFASSLLQEMKIRYLNVKIDTQDRTGIYALESAGFFEAATMLHLVYATNKKRRYFRQLATVRSYRETDLESLRKIARASMRYDHFHSDFHFSKKTSDNLYTALAENCCRGNLADKVFVAERKGKVIGYVACQIRHALDKTLPLRIGNIRHLAVLFPEGFGCGPGLQEAALSWFQDKVDIVESNTTIQNLPIIKISIKTNMEIVASYLKFSKWFGVAVC